MNNPIDDANFSLYLIRKKEKEEAEANELKWHKRFLELAKFYAQWSKDPSTKTGAVIVRPDRTVVSLGYNGFARGVCDYKERYENRDEKYAYIIHCEMNTIITAHEPLHGYTLYTWPFMSCDRCAAHVIQAGIKRCVAPIASEDIVSRWSASIERATQMLKEANVELILLKYPDE